MRRLILILGLSTMLLGGCGSMSKVGPFYEAGDLKCRTGGTENPCENDSPNIDFASAKLAQYHKHFVDVAEKRADSNLTTGNIGIGASMVGVVSAAARSREGVIASLLVGVPSAIFGQRYNLAGQSSIYMRGARNFLCMKSELRDVKGFTSLYDLTPQGERSEQLKNAWQAFQSIPGAVDRRIDDVISRTRQDLMNGVATVDTAMITSSFERYATDLKSAQDKLNKAALILPPAAAGPGAKAAAIPSLTEDQKAQLKALAVKVEAMPAALDKCIAQ